MLNSRIRASLVLLVTLGLPACGGESSSGPMPSYVRWTETLSATNLAAPFTYCKDFTNAKAGNVSADVTPPSIHLVLGAGTCSTPGQILAEKDGVVSVDMPAGSNHITLSSRSDLDTAFTLSLTYWH